MYIPGAITDKRRATQAVPIYKTSNSTYILSGWAQAHSAPNCASATDMKGDNSESKRFFGLIAKVDYADGTAADYHYVPFDCNYTGWQYASGSVVPKQPNKTVSTITVITAYDYNINVGHFDDISLVEEPAQTYTYDDKGNLKATTSTGNSDETFQYNGADLIDQTAGGYGSYHYEYQNHNMIKATNDGVSVTADYDEAGNSTGTRLQKSNGTGIYLQTHATYTTDKDHTASVTDANGGTTNFEYDKLGRNTSISTPIDTGVTSTTNYNYVSGNDRQYRTSNSSGAVLYYGYTNGVQTDASRYSENSQTRPWQRYHLTLDPWGNTTKIQVQSATGITPSSWLTGPTLASYEYAGNNGYLSKMTHANGDYETYTYDRYGRIVTIEHRAKSGALNYTESYIYDGNGNTGRCKVMDGSGNLTDDYRYEYDSLGRLIRSSQVSDGETVLRTEHLYDADNRLTGQSYQLGASSFSEEYKYNSNDGSMKSMDTANGDTLSFTYDAIKRLEKVTAGSRYTKTYSYRTISGNQTTTQISALSYAGFTGAPTYHYTYTANGNISSQWMNNDGKSTYTYDTQGQLTGANIPTDDLSYLYSYDNAGNILQVSASGITAGHTSDNYTNQYSYENESWPDLLTAFNEQNIAYEGQTFNPATGAVSGAPVSGNPVSYFNGTRWDFAWENGRQLATATTSLDEDTELSIAYTYDLNGLRTSKTVTTKTYAVVTHTVTFVADGVTVKTMTVDDGYVLKNSDYPTVPAKAGYVGSWNKYTGPVTSDLTIQASYRQLRRCTVTFKADNVVLKTMTVDEGYMLKLTDYPSIPPKPNYNGIWPSRTSPITTNTTITASYVPKDGSEITIPTVPPDVDVASVGDEEEAEVAPASVGGAASDTGDNSPAIELLSTVTERHDYIYASGRLLRETITTTAEDGTVSTKILDFAYDAQGTPYSLTYTNGTASPVTYYYITNLQGDVTYLINNSGTKVASYSYDPYGQIQQTTGTIAQINPLRYRGYYYDTDTEFYYLQSRYYDATICRFINADSYSSTGQGIIGYNMFAYCNNDPIKAKDSGGEFLNTIIGAVIGGIAGAVTAAVNGDNVWAGAAIGAATGAVAGFAADIAIATGGAGALVGAAIISGAANAANTIATDAVNGRDVNWGNAAIDFVSGSIGGLLTFGTGGGTLQKVGGSVWDNVKKNFTKTLFNGTTKKVGNEIVKRSASIVRKIVAKNVTSEVAMSTVIWAGTFLFSKKAQAAIS